MAKIPDILVKFLTKAAGLLPNLRAAPGAETIIVEPIDNHITPDIIISKTSLTAAITSHSIHLAAMATTTILLQAEQVVPIIIAGRPPVKTFVTDVNAMDTLQSTAGN